jgi:hypothetical protein
MNDQEIVVQIPGRVRLFSAKVQTGSGAHPNSYSMGYVCSFPGSKAVEE